MKYEITGGNLPVVICQLEAGEAIETEGGAMAWMSTDMEMSTSGGGSLGKAFSRFFSGEKVFRNIYTAKSAGFIALASSFPGSIRAVEITPENSLIIQKSAYLGSYGNINTEIVFNKKLGAGLFGGEGFIMQKVSGNGVVFLEIDGSAVDYELEAGQQIIVDTGNLAAMSASCDMDLQSVKGVKNVLFGGEGLFNTIITGPGKVTVQSMPLSEFAKAIQAYLPQVSSDSSSGATIHIGGNK